jgi:hypothetical protein
MSYKYVQKCQCCDEQISIIRIPAICVTHKYELICLMHDELEKLGMKGTLGLGCTDELIVAFNYGYASEAELELSEQMCDRLREIANAFSWRQVSEPEISYYSI